MFYNNNNNNIMFLLFLIIFLSKLNFILTINLNEDEENSLNALYEYIHDSDEYHDFSEKHHFFVNKDHPLSYKSPIEVIEYYDYIGETHYVTTEDGYILEMHRIKGKVNSTINENRKVAFLQHGILCSSMEWIIGGPKRGLGFLLSDAGYDVWIANSRGNRYGRKHTNPNISKKDFWNFSFHEMGIYDLPASIDYVRNVTKQEKLNYIGHSQGTTVFWVLMSEKPEYNDKINVMFALAPIAYTSNMYSPVLKFLAPFTSAIDFLQRLIGLYEFEPTNAFFNKFSSLFCKQGTITQPICKNVIFLICGFDHEQLDEELLPAILSNTPAGSSVKQFIHYGQLIRSGQFFSKGKFRKFDYGFWNNKKKYGTFSPPSYKLNNVKVPVSIHYSSNDWLTDSKDIMKLYDELPNKIGKYHVPYQKFNHMDFMWGKNVTDQLYNLVLSLLNRHQK